jgi:hypothetical protein
MPGALWLGEQSPQTPMSRYDILCLHTIVGFAPAHAAHFSTAGSGRIMQSRDTRFRSAANLLGNHRVLAIENADHGEQFPSWGGSDVPVLTDAQVTACGEILAWAHREHGIPLQLCPDSRPGSRGLAYHRQGIDGNFGSMRFPGRVAGGEKWSSSFGKVCPGDRRIDQRPDVLAVAKDIIGGDQMDKQQEEKLDRALAASERALEEIALVHERLDRFKARDQRQEERAAEQRKRIITLVREGRLTEAELEGAIGRVLSEEQS